MSALYKASRKQGYDSLLVENYRMRSLVWLLFTNRSRNVIWGIYSDFPLELYLLSRLLGKRNHLIIFGIWTEETYIQGSDVKLNLLDKLWFAKFRYYRYITQLFFVVLSNSIIHLSIYGKRLFDSWYPSILVGYKRSTIIYGGADLHSFPASKKQRFQIHRTKDFNLLMVGRIDSRKNYVEALDIARYLKSVWEKNVVVTYVFSTGPHNAYEHLTVLGEYIRKHNLSSSTRILLGLNRREVAAQYKHADAFLMLSKKLETFGLVTLEALRSGCPVFGYDSCATPEIISLYKSMFLSKHKNPKHVADKIISFFSLPSKKRSIVLQELYKTTAKYDWNHSFDSIKPIFK